MKLKDIEKFNQSDPKWAKIKLGTSTVSTISSDGCLLCCVASVLRYYGKDTTPDKLNDDLTRVKGWHLACRLIYGAIHDIYKDITMDWNYYIPCADTGAPLDKIDEILASNRPAIVQVDFKPSTAKLDEHWVVIHGKTENGSYLIIDSIDGSEQFFESRYGDPERYIFKIVAYNGPVPQEETESNDALKARNKKLMEQLIEEGQLITALRADIFKMEQNEAEDQVELVELRERNRKLELDTGRLKKAEDRVRELEEQQKALKLRLVALEKTKIEKMTTKQIVDLLIGRIFRRG